MSSLLRIENISKSYAQPDGSKLIVFQDVNINLEKGSILALTGANGSGKTTLINIIAGNVVPDSGQIYLRDENISDQQSYIRHRFIGRVHQESFKSLASDLTVKEIVAIACKRSKSLSLSFPDLENTMDQLSNLSVPVSVFIDENQDIPSRLLSGGQRQLLAIAVCFLGNPILILLDEHFVSLDNKYKEVADSMLFTYIKRGMGSAIVVTHDIGWSNAVCDHISRLEDQKLSLEK